VEGESAGGRDLVDAFQEERRALKTRFQAGQPDPEARDQAEEDIERFLEADTSAGSFARLAAYPPDRLANVAWKLAHSVLLERLNGKLHVELSASSEWREIYAGVAYDPRVEGATAEEIFSWALIRFNGGEHQFEQVVRRRSAGPLA